MPRRKQGHHCRTNATGGYLKKRPDTGSQLFEKPFATNTDLVFKIKKTLSTTLSNTREKIEREPVEAAPKSLNNANMVSESCELNNNTIVGPHQEQEDEDEDRSSSSSSSRQAAATVESPSKPVIPSQMSGVSPGDASDPQKMNYRVSTSVTESRGGEKTDNSKDPPAQRNCQLPSSVYGSPASSIEKVLTGLKEEDSSSSSTPEVKLKLHIPPEGGGSWSGSEDSSSQQQRPAKIPKITSPQILEQHISKIISENAAIVETLDPKWSRRYFKQADAPHSKLQSALLGGSEWEQTTVLVPPPPSLKLQPNNNSLSALVPPVNLYSEDELKGSAIKSLLSLKRGRYANNRGKNPFFFDKDVHPQNPEGSIIKDLLLKNKSKEWTTDPEDRILLDASSVFYRTPSPLLKCPHCSSEFSDRYGLDFHLSLCKSAAASKQQHSLREKNDAQKPAEDGILKKQLLLPLSPPTKRRKVSDSVLAMHQQQPPLVVSRSHSVHLFGGEVQIVDGDRTKRIRIKTSLPGAFTTHNRPAEEEEEAVDEFSSDVPSVVVTIAQPVHNSGGTVHVPGRRSPTELFAQQTDLLNFSCQSIAFLPGPPDRKAFQPEETSSSSSPTRLTKSFHPHSTVEKECNRALPTVVFTPSSPTQGGDAECPASSEQQQTPVKKFLAPSRPTSLPLKKKPFTMVGSTLISPETPRPKKTCIQLYLNGHAYTYLGLKCSTRSTYCCIYRPQPMFVPQETNPKLSMYSNWQVVPAKEELAGLTPGQMISFYCSKQRRDHRTVVATARLGEPLIFTHSSYWTYRSTDPTGNKKALEDAVEKEEIVATTTTTTTTTTTATTTTTLKLEKNQDPPPSNDHPSPENKPSSEPPVTSADESSLHLDTDNATSDPDVNNSEEEDDDEYQDDGTESLTDSSQPQPPKRIKIFEGGFKSNEDYTYVRGRGRGKYVCEECGIRCKKPSMLKKHIRTHTDLRPYKCKHCSFAFKTKGNLTKHMKSKAHHKKCTELGIIPVPTTTDDSQIDEEALAKQEQIEKKKTQFSDGEDADDDDDDTDETDDECESDASSMIISNPNSRMLTNGHSKKTQDKVGVEQADESRGGESVSQQSEEQEAARSLLHLSAIGEPSQWSTSTGDLTDVASSCDADSGSLVSRHDPTLLSPQYVSQTVASVILPNTRSKTVPDQWLSTETLGHRPRSYSADIPLGGGKELLTKYRLVKGISSDTNEKANVDGSEFGSKDQYTRRYSISVAREARKPRVIPAPEWNALGLPTPSPKWPETESPDQPMDLSISRDLGKYKSTYGGGTLLSVVTQEEPVPDRHLQTSLESCLSEQYQLKSLPVLSPQVVADYDASVDSSSNETPLLSLTDDQNAFSSAGSTSRSVYYMQDVPPAENTAGRKETEAAEDPPSPDIDYSACSPVSPTTLDENSYYYSQENIGHGSSSNEEMQSSTRAHAEFIVPSSSSSMEEGKCVCRICNKIFAKSSHLRLHVNIHYFERPFRCDNCAVSFRTKGHLQKHKRSVSHYNKVNMNLTFGTPTVDNPRPFKCADCKIAFRIHGHLAKHLRSKMHIMKLECLGKLPFGMYAEMERSGVSLNEIDTTDCNNSLESLQVMAQKLYQRDPRRMRWQGPDQSAVETECAMPAPSVASTLLEPILPITDPMPTTFDPSCSAINIPSMATSKQLSESSDVKHEPSEVDSLRIPVAYTDGDSAISLSRYVISQPVTTANQETNQRVDVAESDSSVSLNRSGTCHMCGRLFKSAKFLQVHLYSDHSSLITSISDVPPSNSSVSSVASLEMNCDLCGKMFPNQKALQQHLLSHAQPRPFVCEICDAGFTSSSSLIAHQATHQITSSQSSVSETRLVQLK